MTTDHRDELLDLFHSTRAKYDLLLAEFKEDDLYISGDFETLGIIPANSNDPGLKLTKPSNVYDSVENAASHILSFPRTLVPVRPVTKDKEAAIKVAQKKQRFIELCWDRFFYEQGDPLGIAKKQLIKGKCTLKLEIDWRHLPPIAEDASPAERRKFRETLQKIARSKFIFTLRAVPKETVFEDPDNPHDPEFVFETYSCTVKDARRKWPHLKEKLVDRDGRSNVNYIEYYSKPCGSDPGEFVQWIDEEIAHQAENPYSWETPISTEDAPDYDGFIPHAVGDPGWGDVGADAKPEDRYISLVRPMRSMALADCRNLTSLEAYLRLYIWKPLLTSGYPDSAQFKLGPGAHWERDPETQSIDLLQFGEMPAALLQGAAYIRRTMDEHSKFGSLGGSPQRGVDTATEATQNVQLASAMLSAPVRTLRRMVANVNTKIFQCVEKVLEVPLTVYGATRTGESEVTLTPRDISGLYLTSVELETSDEAQLSIRIARIFTDMYGKLPIAAEDVLEKAGWDNPRDTMDRRLLEDLERTPQAMQVLQLAMLTGLAQTVPQSKLVEAAFVQALAGLQGATKPPGAASSNTLFDPIEAMRAETRDDAIAEQPERTMQ